MKSNNLDKYISARATAIFEYWKDNMTDDETLETWRVNIIDDIKSYGFSDNEASTILHWYFKQWCDNL